MLLGVRVLNFSFLIFFGVVYTDAFHLGEEFDSDDESRPEYLCPFCAEDFDTVGLCCHIDEEHPVEGKNGVLWFYTSFFLFYCCFKYWNLQYSSFAYFWNIGVVNIAIASPQKMEDLNFMFLVIALLFLVVPILFLEVLVLIRLLKYSTYSPEGWNICVCR